MVIENWGKMKTEKSKIGRAYIWIRKSDGRKLEIHENTLLSNSWFVRGPEISYEFSAKSSSQNMKKALALAKLYMEEY